MDGVGVKWNKLVSGCHFSVEYNGRPHHLFFVLCRESKDVFREIFCNLYS